MSNPHEVLTKERSQKFKFWAGRYLNHDEYHLSKRTIKRRRFRFFEPPTHPDKTWGKSIQALKLRMEREIQKYEWIVMDPYRSERNMTPILTPEEESWVKEIKRNMRVLEAAIKEAEEQEPIKLHLYDVQRFN